MKRVTATAMLLITLVAGCGRQVSTDGLPPQDAITAQLEALQGRRGDAFLTIQEVGGDAMMQIAKTDGKFALMIDTRIIHYSLEETETRGDFSKTFYNPFVGIEYNFIKRVKIVFAYGIDPVSYDRSYDGRQTGRWDYRQEYMWEHEDATIIDAEESLNDVMAFTFRATFRF